MESVVIGTAGHIDHGKTALIQALTGTNPDRLPEEQQRGMTIDLGFADLPYAGRRFAFVDVPGHERFIKTMLAGAQGIDLVLFVIAADEGVMPQTTEHLAICHLLGLSHGVVALTKSDLVTEDWLALVREDVNQLTQRTFLAGKPRLPVSAKTGAGLSKLLVELEREARQVRPRDAARPPRLPVDRVFSARGFGTVVTGTLIAGTFSVGDEVSIEPRGLAARIRGIEVHGETRSSVQAGERAALNLSPISVEDVRRGSVVTPAGRFQPTSLLDVQLEVLAAAPQPLADEARIRFHHGTSELMARVTLLDGARELAPGETGFGQLRLEAPVLALPGDRFIIRRYSPAGTLGGGVVLDGRPPRRRGRLRSVANFLSQLAEGPESRRMAFISRAGARGLTLRELAQLTGESDAELETFAQRATGLTYFVASKRLVDQSALTNFGQEVFLALEAAHREQPFQSNFPREDIRQRVAATFPTEVFQHAISQLINQGRIVADARVMRLAEHRVELSNTEAALKHRVEDLCRQAGWQPPTLAGLCRALNISPPQAQTLVRLLLAERKLYQITDFFLHVEAAEALVARLRAAYPSGATLDVGAFKTLCDLPRKFAIPLLEWLDQTNVTRRYGNTRVMI
ncbi:MAG: selenocysteine-specific translation elongation factor [Chloracidobacterium sp.]|uniref:Selenocysteine-specific elongation factor n=1 Tax=Chloracidobacterium validum TaxID=2821543 RepID=A0ABX8B610_9BACT|nr:selenocysteine-specific translation elongation factor [Chloracidobacterium validum]QUW02089.1 selenocysteine-specific translation elongation factor [Chloracidobacterium validum]